MPNPSVLVPAGGVAPPFSPYERDVLLLDHAGIYNLSCLGNALSLRSPISARSPFGAIA